MSTIAEAHAPTEPPSSGWRSAAPGDTASRRSENRGRAWLLISFLLCPCHLPVTLGVIAAVAGGTAIGAALTASLWRLGVVVGILYALALWRGFHHLRRAQRSSCETDACEVSWSDVVSSG